MERGTETPSELERTVRRKGRGGTGWLIGILVGVLVGLWILPPVRSTLSSQLDFALALDSLPWMRPLNTDTGRKEAARLDRAAQLLPDDYLLQVGRATAFVEQGGVRGRQNTANGTGGLNDSDHSLIRLTGLAHNFPLSAGARAHLVRYMMADRVRILRAEIVPPNSAPESLRSIPPRFTDLKLTLWALENGERLDRDNAFWPAMTAITQFAAGHDEKALAALARASSKSYWQSYLYEEVLGQWRIYSVAYGDHGALQKIGPLSFIAFPHLQQLRRMAEMARWHADLAAANQQVGRAIQIRASVRGLGRLLRDTASWAYEALYGTDLILIGASDSAPATPHAPIRSVADWQKQAIGYIGFLTENEKLSERTLIRTEIEDSLRLRQMVDVARADASYPGIPPGIQLLSLFGCWMAGVSLVQQLLLLTLVLGAILVWQRLDGLGGAHPPLLKFLFWCLVIGVPSGISLLLFSSLPSSRLSILLFGGIALLTLMVADAGQRRWWRTRRNHAAILRARILAGESDLENFGVPVARGWSRGTTVRFLVVIVLPGLAQLWLFLPTLSSLHPVALLLTSLVGMDVHNSVGTALLAGYLACALPFLLLVALTLWALRRNVAISEAIPYGVKRLYLPTVIAVCLVYLVLLNQTLRYDSVASHAINEAARDDLHWVLTHSEAK